MIENQLNNRAYDPVNRPRGNDQRSDLLARFGCQMVVIGICFPLYYLGFFGSVNGPLHPALLGERLLDMGITRTHVLMISSFIVLLTLIWNWVHNWVSRRFGYHLTCTMIKDRDTSCNAPIRQKSWVPTENGSGVWEYMCVQGHRQPQASYNAVRKGPYSHMVWITAMLLLGFLSFHSY